MLNRTSLLLFIILFIPLSVLVNDSLIATSVSIDIFDTIPFLRDYSFELKFKLLGYLISLIYVLPIVFFMTSKPTVRFLGRILDIRRVPNQPIHRSTIESKDIERLDKKISMMQESINSGFSEKSIQEIHESIVNQIVINDGQKLTDLIEKKYSKHLLDISFNREILNEVNLLTDTLQTERGVVSFRTGLNLLIGLGIGTAGLILIYFGVIKEYQTKVDSNSFDALFVARISFSILLQLLAFFFLSLYKNGLQEIKYFRNEMTNISMIKLSLMIELEKGTQRSQIAAASQLLKAERNFILKKGERVAAIAAFEDMEAAQERAVRLIETISNSLKKN